MTLLITAAIKGTLVLVAAFVATILARRNSADLRHKIWLAALAGCVFLLVPFRLAESVSLIAATASATAKAGAVLTRSVPWVPALWATGFALLLARFTAGIIKLNRITKRARRVADAYETDDVRTPLTWGAIRPAILLPSYIAGWPEGQREMVIRHERAHIDRHDWLWQTFAQFVAALFWFHPLVWFAVTQLRKEAEHAADDAILAAGINGADYADRLLDVARLMLGRAPSNAVAMVRERQLTSRIAAILDPTRNRVRSGVRARVAVIAAGIAVILPLTAFQNSGPYKVGNGVSAPKVVYRVAPSYTEEAKAAKVEGSVTIQVTVNRYGQPQDLQVTKPLEPGLDANALVAVSQWTFEPGMKDGQPVDVLATIEINFKLL